MSLNHLLICFMMCMEYFILSKDLLYQDVFYCSVYVYILGKHSKANIPSKGFSSSSVMPFALNVYITLPII